MNINNIYRDKTIDCITEEDVGKSCKAAGWVENIRDHGGVSFVDLRDMYGVLQVVMRDTSLLNGLSKEDCISIEGVIEHRDEETYNPKIPTGTIELEAHKVTVLGQDVELTATEFRLIEDLLRNAGRVRTREELLAAVWGYQFEGYARTVDTHIRRLRNKLGDAAEIIETVRGVGYRCKE